jgi:mRNA-degrading endonuclease RelE of RelBE toxin-antitoxin system
MPEKIRRGLLQKLKELALHPALGKPLVDDLQGCYRLTYARYRCIVRMTEGIAVVLVLVVAKRQAGSRADAYEIALRVVAQSDPSVQEIFARHIRAYAEEQRLAGTPPVELAPMIKSRERRTKSKRNR